MSRAGTRKLKVENSLDKVGICPICKLGSTLREWEEITLGNCASRLLRRDYISIKDRRALKKESKLRYLCPYCQRYSLGHTIKLETQEDYNSYVSKNDE